MGTTSFWRSNTTLPHNEFSCYDSKPSDIDPLVLEFGGNVEYLFIVITPRSTRNGSTC